MKATFILVLIFLYLFYLPAKVEAVTQNIFISELLPDATGTDTGKEYIELYNNSSAEVQLNGWSFNNISQSGTSKKVTIPTITIKSKQYFTVAEDLALINISEGISIGSGKLALYNDFGRVQLLDSSNALVQEISYGDSKEGIAWDFDGPLCNNFNYAASNTPGAVNSSYKSECYSIQTNPVSSPVSYSQPVSQTDTLVSNVSNKLLISEVYPSPESPDKEWIELYNSDTSDISLVNYYVEEKISSGISNYRFKMPDQTIKPGAYLVINEDDFNVSLNNSGDSIYLVDINKNIINQFTYTEVSKSASAGRVFINGSYTEEIKQTLTPTPLSENKFGNSPSTVIPIISVNQIQNYNSGDQVILNVNINNYIDKYIFLEDTSGKIKAKLTNYLYEDLSLTSVNLKAKISVSSGIKNILIDPEDIQVIDYLNPIYNQVLVDSFKVSDIGCLVKLSGIVKEIYSNRLKIQIADKLLNIYTNSSFDVQSNLKDKEIIVMGTLDYYRNAFRIIVNDYSFSQIAGINAASVSYPTSYSVKTSNVITNNIEPDNSKQNIVSIGYVVLVLVTIFEVVKNIKTIKKFVLSNIKRSFNLKSKPVIKY